MTNNDKKSDYIGKKIGYIRKSSLRRKNSKNRGDNRRSRSRRSRSRRSRSRRSRSRRSSKNCPYKKLQPIMQIKRSDCEGAIKNTGIVKYKQKNILSFNELFCVIANNKPLALIELSYDLINSYFRKNMYLINEIINLANKCGIKAIIHSYNNIPNMVVFNKKYKSDAILVLYLNTTKRGIQSNKNPYLLGRLYGYSENNIKAFYKRMYNMKWKLYFDSDKKNYNNDKKIITNSNDYNQFKLIQKNKIINIPLIK
jgi:hypothetical protein